MLADANCKINDITRILIIHQVPKVTYLAKKSLMLSIKGPSIGKTWFIYLIASLHLCLKPMLIKTLSQKVQTDNPN